MRCHSYRPLRKLTTCLAGLLMLVFVTGCAGVQGAGNQPYLPQANSGSSPTPGTSQSQGTPEPGSIAFTGPVQSVNANTIAVKMPNGQSLTAGIVNGQTDLSDFNGTPPNQGQVVQIKATASTGGSFTATKIKQEDGDNGADQNIVEYEGLTTSAVGSDRVLHFRVGNQDFNFTLGPTTNLEDFQGNAQAIGNNQSIKVKVQFQGTSATVLQVERSNQESND